MFQRLIIGILLRLLDSSFRIDYKQIDKQAMEDWCWRSFDDKGWRSYFAYTDMQILKSLSFGKNQDEYMALIGGRLRLMLLFDEMRKAVEMKKTKSEKEKAKAEQNIKKNGS
jgi:hypothetical protein